MLRKSIILAVAATLAPMPILIYAQENLDEITNRAKFDAKIDFNRRSWITAGCCLSVAGVLYASAAEPTPPPERLLGKSKTYVEAYKTAYIREGKKLQSNAASLGCLLGIIPIGVGLFVGGLLAISGAM